MHFPSLKSTLFLTILSSALALISTPSCSNNKKVHHSQSKKQERVLEVSFDTSMGQSAREWNRAMANPEDVKNYLTLKQLYEKNLPSKVAASKTPKIPKIIHQIWLGPKLPPIYFNRFSSQWRKMHPDWEYRLWTDKDLDLLGEDLRVLVNQTTNWAEKSDIFRSEILDRFGGVYVDVDIDCLHPLDELHHKYDFYAACEFPHLVVTKPNRIWVGISIIASKPGHPIIRTWKQKILAGWAEMDKRFSDFGHRVVNRTYFPFSYSVWEQHSKDNDVDIVFPATYFYPISGKRRAAEDMTYRDQVKNYVNTALHYFKIKKPTPYSQVQPETLAVHYWGNTWIQGNREYIHDLRFQVESMKAEIAHLNRRINLMEKKSETADCDLLP